MSFLKVHFVVIVKKLGFSLHLIEKCLLVIDAVAVFNVEERTGTRLH